MLPLGNSFNHNHILREGTCWSTIGSCFEDTFDGVFEILGFNLDYNITVRLWCSAHNPDEEDRVTIRVLSHSKGSGTDITRSYTELFPNFPTVLTHTRIIMSADIATNGGIERDIIESFLHLVPLEPTNDNLRSLSSPCDEW